MNHLFTKEQTKEFLDPYLPIFKDCFDEALAKLNYAMDDLGVELFNRTKANILYDLIVKKIKSRTQDIPSIKCHEEYESFLFIIEGKVSIRIKKVDVEGNPSNIKTNRNENILGQQLSLFADELPPIMFLDFAY